MTDSIETSESEALPWTPPGAPATPTPAAAVRGAHLDAAPTSLQQALANMFERNSVAMAAAVIDARQHGPAEGMRWIVNTLAGPGLLPDIECTDAQAYFEQHAPSISACCFVSSRAATPAGDEAEHHGLDNARQVLFYEQDFYVLSNFSSFTLEWNEAEKMRFDTSEAAYHWEKFPGHDDIRAAIINAPSAHEAFKIAERNKAHRRADWDLVKVGIMRRILRAKADQHEYVRRKLLTTGDRELVENSWRDAYWGWGPNRDGQNMLGRLWMEVRAELRSAQGGAA